MLNQCRYWRITLDQDLKENCLDTSWVREMFFSRIRTYYYFYYNQSKLRCYKNSIFCVTNPKQFFCRLWFDTNCSLV